MERTEMFGLFLLLAVLAINACDAAKFNGHKVIRILPKNNDEVEYAKDLSLSYKIDFWRDVSVAGQPVDVNVGAQEAEELQNDLKQRNILHSVFIDDVQKIIDEQKSANNKVSTTRRKTLDFDYGRYHKYDEIVLELERISKTYGNITTLLTFGKSFEGQVMYGIQIAIDPSVEKEIVFIECGIHAREWISPATCMYIIKEIIDNHHTKATYRMALERFEFVVLPVLNVDGYRYTHSEKGDRLWRKTRSIQKDCYGVDPNRNWNYAWAGPGSSSSSCDGIYRGESPFSEIEVMNVAQYLMNIRTKLVSFYDLHSYGQLWITPWCSKSSYPADYKEMERVVMTGIEALSSEYSTSYEHGSPPHILYTASGASIDWTYGYLKVVHSYVLELRDKGQYGFLLPPDQIAPTGMETTAGIMAAVNAM